MSHRRLGGPNCLVRWGAILSSAAFFTATNYCTLEVLAAQAVPAESAHHSEAAGHSHESGLPARGGDSELCCVALQAILQPTSDLGFARPDAPVLRVPALQARQPELPAHLVHSASGLKPPIRDPVPRTPFYHTVFASHAPPACLA